ncbi:MAG: nicotinate phosphoribosyltransferase [Planctomycetes bacterium]|nr:nicotinate phosphoribosyltransferase [Planctomycetota bacterium]
MTSQQRKLSPEDYDFDYDGLRRGYYSDAYFANGARVLQRLSEEAWCYSGEHPRANVAHLDPTRIPIGDIEVEMQFFTKRKPYSLAAGVDAAATILRECTGYFRADGTFVNTGDKLEIDAVPEGCKLMPRAPAMKVRGRYRDFAAQETTTLGVMTRATLVATNVHRALEAARGKPVLFFPARFDTHTTQPMDGYAYKLALDAYNRQHATALAPLVSTNAQGKWWDGTGGGTVAHAYILCFLADCAEAMLAFAQHTPPEVKRVALVDTDDDCVRDSARVAVAFFLRHMALTERGQADEAKRYRLFGVRADTAADVCDVSVEPTGDGTNDCGVCPRLIENIRRGLDALHESAEIPSKWRAQARECFRDIKIIVSGGFDDERIATFEALGVPVDVYGVGSYFFSGSNIFTADLVRVKIAGEWHDMAKVGREPRDNADLERIQ